MAKKGLRVVECIARHFERCAAINAELGDMSLTKEEWLSMLYDRSTYRGFTLVEDARVWGYVWCRLDWEDNQLVWYILSFVVHPDAEERGGCDLLVQHVIAKAACSNCAAVFVPIPNKEESQETLHMFVRNGFWCPVFELALLQLPPKRQPSYLLLIWQEAVAISEYDRANSLCLN